jgi:hypothetical protein
MASSFDLFSFIIKKIERLIFSVDKFFVIFSFAKMLYKLFHCAQSSVMGFEHCFTYNQCWKSFTCSFAYNHNAKAKQVN